MKHEHIAMYYIVAMWMHTYILNIIVLCAFTLVPTPLVVISILNNQTVGQSLTLECSVTTAKGITSRVDIVWRKNDLEIKRIEGVSFSSFTNNSKLVQFTDFYVLPQLSTSDEGRLFQCQVLVNRESPVKVTNSVSLNVTG